MTGRFLREVRGASAAEFALILPAALLLLFGVVDVGRYAWQLNQYEKAVQLGARYAVATTVIPGALAADDAFLNQSCNGATLNYGDTICADAMQPITCEIPNGGNDTDQVTCSCDATVNSGACLSASPRPLAFAAIVSRMRVASKRIQPGEVSIGYIGSGLGYLGDPATYKDSNGVAVPLPDAAPIVTVKLTNMRYQPITLTLIGIDVPYPDFSYSLTLEDGDGTVAS
ncbi:TadE/TadG family type IV pilus assembly protein [Croceicoccus bisphenolivorans]|uniref:TadE/TadG family type IV pilus assembly protein n=1 Tax=Croceicoccus bisphenolivorans TaxID=1783232 RepID=UPI000836EDE6|nr:TadE/TadG family type IV pilus assembly protein [Croceicoccus bisphenolivorans]